MEQKNNATLRVDKWLWYARVFKTRTLAQKHVRSGKVRLNKTKLANPAATVTSGDVLVIARGGELHILEVVECGTHRGPFEQAKLLYNDLSPPKAKPEEKPFIAPTPGEGPRPSKHDRRKRVAWQKGSER